ncbi:MAG: protein-L-isoaspartate(D-aspartate) O-methyltransferase [Patescibacteria group bacterium]
MIPSAEDYQKQRERMVADQLVRHGIHDERILEAFRMIPRHLFVLPQDSAAAYEDYPLPIGFGQTISQPYMVAYMTQQLELKNSDRVLEIGTGSGFGAAILGQIAHTVFTLEIVPELYSRAAALLKRLNMDTVVCILRSGYEGLPQKAPFDKIVLTAAPQDRVPELLLDQLKVGGRLIAPIGSIRIFQRLIQYDKHSETEFKETELMGVSFVEMVQQYS